RALGYVSWKTGSKRHNQGNLYILYPAGDGPGESSKTAPPAGMKRSDEGFNTAPPAGMERPGGGEDDFNTAPPAGKQRHHLPVNSGTTCRPQRTSNRETVTERYRGKYANGCSHPDTAVCPK